MFGDCGDNYVFLENAIFSDSDSSFECCKEIKNIFCAFGKKIGFLFLSYINKNFMIVNFVFKELNLLSFLVTWYNVNGFYFYGFILKDDLDYFDKIKFDRLSISNSEDDLIDSIYIVVTVIFSIVVFVVIVIVACKFGRYFFGFRCSLEYCCVWIAVKRG